MPPKKSGGGGSKSKDKEDQSSKDGKEKKGGTAVKVSSPFLPSFKYQILINKPKNLPKWVFDKSLTENWAKDLALLMSLICF